MDGIGKEELTDQEKSKGDPWNTRTEGEGLSRQKPEKTGEITTFKQEEKKGGK